MRSVVIALLFLLLPTVGFAEADVHTEGVARPPGGVIKEFTHIDSLIENGILKKTDLVPVPEFVSRMYDVSTDEKGKRTFNVKENRGFEVWNIGPEKKTIMGGTDLGPITRDNGPKIVDAAMATLPKLANGEPDLNREIMIYCGCCPAHSCPFVIGAVQVLKARGLTNIKVINFEEGLNSEEWIDSNMPTQPRALIVKK